MIAQLARSALADAGAPSGEVAGGPALLPFVVAQAEERPAAIVEVAAAMREPRGFEEGHLDLVFLGGFFADERRGDRRQRGGRVDARGDSVVGAGEVAQIDARGEVGLGEELGEEREGARLSDAVDGGLIAQGAEQAALDGEGDALPARILGERLERGGVIEAGLGEEVAQPGEQLVGGSGGGEVGDGGVGGIASATA